MKAYKKVSLPCLGLGGWDEEGLPLGNDPLAEIYPLRTEESGGVLGPLRVGLADCLE